MRLVKTNETISYLDLEKKKPIPRVRVKTRIRIQLETESEFRSDRLGYARIVAVVDRAVNSVVSKIGLSQISDIFTSVVNNFAKAIGSYPSPINVRHPKYQHSDLIFTVPSSSTSHHHP